MKEVKIGIVGLGGFGQFVLESYKNLKNANVVAVSDKDKDITKKIATKYKVKAYNDHKKMLNEIDLLVIATPPFTHYNLVMDAIKFKKYVLVEKPLAINMEQAKKIKNKIKPGQLKIDYILRENPLIKDLKKAIKSNLFGELQSIVFQNHATDLKKDHWFWQKKKSGGIWIEHGVHFFDLFRYLLEQEPSKFASQISKRGKIQDQVFCTCKYNNAAATFIHSFSKPREIESTSYTLSFDRATITINGWIPLEMQINAMLTKNQQNQLNKIFSNKLKFKKINKNILTRGKTCYAESILKQNIKLRGTKQKVYKKSIEKVMQNFVNSILKKEKLDFGFEEAYNSLKDATSADSA